MFISDRWAIYARIVAVLEPAVCTVTPEFEFNSSTALKSNVRRKNQSLHFKTGASYIVFDRSCALLSIVRITERVYQYVQFNFYNELVK